MQERSTSATPATSLSCRSTPPARRSRRSVAPAPTPRRRRFSCAATRRSRRPPISRANASPAPAVAVGGWGQFPIDATLEKTGFSVSDATFAALGPVDAKIALLVGSIDGWAVWEPYVSYATIKDHARIIANGQGLTPTITFIVASDAAIASKRAAVQDLVQRLNKARLWSLDYIADYARSTA